MYTILTDRIMFNWPTLCFATAALINSTHKQLGGCVQQTISELISQLCVMTVQFLNVTILGRGTQKQHAPSA